MNFLNRAGGAVACAILAHAAGGQTLNIPKGYMWSSHVPTSWNFAGNPMIKQMIHLNLNYSILLDPDDPFSGFAPGTIGAGESGAYKTGRAAAKRVEKWGIQSGDIVIMLDKFGLEGDPDSGNNHKFYRPEDWLWPSLEGSFPTGDTTSNKTYRHPFLANAGFGFALGTGEAILDAGIETPLMAWMSQFCAGYEQEQLERASGPTPYAIPDPDKFYFDTEVAVTPAQNPNYAYMLFLLASDYEIWSTWPVPGYTIPPFPPATVGTPQTLKMLYQARVGDGIYDWPADTPPSPPALGVAGILDASEGIVQNQYGNYFRNIEYMIWWGEICSRALGEVMKYSAYDIIKAEWPNAKCGNYREFAADGLDTIPGASGSDRTPWFQDRPYDNNTLDYPRDYDTPTILSRPNEYLPRFAMNKDLGNVLQFGNLTAGQRYLGFPWYRTGDVDSPVLYPGTQTQHDSYRQQRDYYRPGHPLTLTGFEAARLMARRDVETAINSNGGGSEDVLVPWVMMSSTEESTKDSNNEDIYLNYFQFREMQAMLRSKNIKECLFWTQVPQDVYDNGSPAWQALEQAWDETAYWFPRVYATRIDNYTRATGPLGGYSSFDRSRLEFTLPQPSNPANREYEVEVKCNPLVSGVPSNVTTSLIVDLEWRHTTYLDQTLADIYIESSVTELGVTGKVYMWDDTNSVWVPLTIPECPNNDPTVANTYTFNAPKSDSDDRYRSRERFVDRSLLIFQTGSGSALKNITRLKLVHELYGEVAFTSRYDLVQLIPTGDCPATGGDLMIAPRSDMNTDGVVNASDIDTFIDDWMSDMASADLNLNGEIDSDDVDIFEAAYASGT